MTLYQHHIGVHGGQYVSGGGNTQITEYFSQLGFIDGGGGQPAVIVYRCGLLLAVCALNGDGGRFCLRDFPLCHRCICVIGMLFVLVVCGLEVFELGFQVVALFLQRLLVLRLLQQLQLVFHDLQVLRLPVIVDLGALHGGLCQGGVIAHQHRALLDAVALLDPHLLHRLALGDVDLLQFVRGHHAAGVGGVPPVVGHGALVDGVYVHVAPLGVPGDGQSAPHRAAHAHHAGGGDNALFQLLAHARLLAVGALFADMQLFPQRQLLTHSRHLPTVRRPVWS